MGAPRREPVGAGGALRVGPQARAHRWCGLDGLWIPLVAAINYRRVICIVFADGDLAAPSASSHPQRIWKNWHKGMVSLDPGAGDACDVLLR